MKISLRTRLVGAFFGLILFSVALTWILNVTLLEKSYYKNKEEMLYKSYSTIKEEYENNSENLMLSIEKIESIGGMAILIFDSNNNVIYQSREKNSQLSKGKLHLSSLEQFSEKNLLQGRFKQLSENNPKIEIRYDNRMDSNFISLYALIGDNVYLYLGAPMAAIEESSNIAVRFSVFTGILTLILGGIIIFILTSRLSKPIVKLNEIAKKMTVLDFKERYDVKRRDEIGTLGESINSLSCQLEKSIGELREANCKLQQDIEKERKIDEMRKGFISNVSHELKTPIALVQGYAEGLKLNVNDDEENKNYYCEVIIDEANKMNNMVKKLLQLSELEFNNIELEREDFDLCEMIQDIIRKKSIIFSESNVNVTFDNNGNESIMINADYYLIEQVVLNYLSNALHHINDKKIINISIWINGNKARVEVFNSGKNIPEDQVDNIWMSFYKVDKARTRAYGGTGLGLSIVKATQKAHNNGYGVVNMPEGVMFWFEADLK